MIKSLGSAAIGSAGSLIGSASAVVNLETLVLINKHAFLPGMEYITKNLYGAIGEDPLKTEQELTYAWETYFDPVFDWVDKVNDSAKNALEEATGLDLNRDGEIGVPQVIQQNGDQGTGVEGGTGNLSVPIPDRTHKGKGSGTIKITGDQTLDVPFAEWVKQSIEKDPDFDLHLFNIAMSMNTEGGTISSTSTY